jgi:hypothetical protein
MITNETSPQDVLRAVGFNLLSPEDMVNVEGVQLTKEADKPLTAHVRVLDPEGGRGRLMAFKLTPRGWVGLGAEE